MPALSGHAAWRWYGMDGYNDSGNWRWGWQCAAVVAVSHGSAGKGEACLAAPGEPRSLSCLGQAARDRPLPGNLECVGPACRAVSLGAAGR